MSDLRPCPFCGAKTIGVENTEPPSPPLWWVDCYECGESSAPRDSEALAIERWNRRAAMSEGGEQA